MSGRGPTAAALGGDGKARRRSSARSWRGSVLLVVGFVVAVGVIRMAMGDDSFEAGSPEAVPERGRCCEREPLGVESASSTPGLAVPSGGLGGSDAADGAVASPALREVAHARFAHELAAMAESGAEEKIVDALEAAMDAGRFGTRSQYLVYLLGHIGTRTSESVLYQVIDTPLPDADDAKEEALLFISNGLLALANVVGRMESLDAQLHFVRLLEQKIGTGQVTFIRTVAARLYLNHAADKEWAKTRIRELLGGEFAFIADIKDRVPSVTGGEK